jgi:tRNA-dihydrouridine synthase 1
MTDTRPPLDLDDHVKKAWEFYKKIGSPQHVAAPMVDQSELGFRMMNRKYNTHLCYTPMMHAR